MALFYLYTYIRNAGKSNEELVHFYAGTREDADKQFEEKYGTEIKKFVERSPW